MTDSMTADQRPEELSADDLSSDAQKAMFEYWQKARGKGQLPPKTALDPVEFPRGALPVLAVVEPAEDDDFRVRITGTGIRAATGRDFTGEMVRGLDGAEPAHERLLWCRDTARPDFVTGTAKWAEKDGKYFSALLMPFGAPGQVERIVLVFNFTNYAPEDSND